MTSVNSRGRQTKDTDSVIDIVTNILMGGIDEQTPPVNILRMGNRIYFSAPALVTSDTRFNDNRKSF